MFSLAKAAQLALLVAVEVSSHPTKKPSYVSSLPEYAQSLFTQSMDWMDGYYDSEAGYLFDESSATGLRHETRSSAWYAIGLLARNNGSDVEDALKIITNVIDAQFKDPADLWYGDYQQEPEEPTVGTVAYPEKFYNSWDPNWRGFIGTAFIVGLEEFPHLITPEVTKLLEESLYNNTVGDSHRGCHVNGDNLCPAYTNPSLMRAFTAGWTGRRLNDTNMTASGELYANEVLDLFNRANTLSEFNSGTYTGVSLWALSLWSKYLPSDSVMGSNGPKMIQYTWAAVSELWHPDLKNIAGPWDRSYGFDMNRYLSLMALHIWAIVGKEKSSLIAKTPAVSHIADFAYGPLFAIMSSYQNSLITTDVVNKLNTFSGEHTFISSAYSPPYDIYPRNISAWLASNISIGAEAFNETVVGGPAINPGTFNPGVIQWETGDGVGWINLYATESYILAEASANTLNLSYPIGTAASQFSFIVSPFKAKKDVSTWADVQGLTVKVITNANETYEVGYAGEYGGSYSVINDFEFWNFTYTMPDGFVGVPSLSLEVELW